jgi:hypothetical protein
MRIVAVRVIKNENCNTNNSGKIICKWYNCI